MLALDDCSSGLIERAKNAYVNPRGRSLDEFLEDLARLKYIKRLINRRIKRTPVNDRLLLNHVIIWFNAFEPREGLSILLGELDPAGITVLLAYTDYIHITTAHSHAADRDAETVDNLQRL